MFRVVARGYSQDFERWTDASNTANALVISHLPLSINQTSPETDRLEFAVAGIAGDRRHPSGCGTGLQRRVVDWEQDARSPSV